MTQESNKMNSSKKKIQQLLYSGLGGPGNVFTSLVKSDVDHKYSHNAIFCGIEPLREEYVKLCEELSIPYVYYKKRTGLDLRVYARLLQSFRKTKPDILFIHGVSFILPAFIYKLFNRRHRLIIRDTTAHHLKTTKEWIWLFFCLLIANDIVLLTQEAANGIKRKLRWIPRRKIKIIPNGLDVMRYFPLSREAKVSKIVIGMQSRLFPAKDHMTLLKAFKILTDRNPSCEIVLEIAGDGITRKKIEDTIDAMRLRNSVKMHGMLNQSDLVQFMQSLDIYVHATFGETLSNSIIQAMSCGLPIIASDVWGVNNMVKHEETGLLYKSKDAEQLAFLLEELIKDSQKRKWLGNEARIFAENNYSTESMFKRYQNLFDKD